MKILKRIFYGILITLILLAAVAVVSVNVFARDIIQTKLSEVL